MAVTERCLDTRCEEVDPLPFDPSAAYTEKMNVQAVRVLDACGPFVKILGILNA